jgi:5-methyltetrahydropteroyltriglutamate--homocysteine methyltransferase
MDLEGLCTTVVGSFPLSNTKENMIRVFDDLINMRIDFPCYAQLVPMNPQFLSPLSKIISSLEEKEKDVFVLHDDFTVPNKPVALEYGQFMNDFLEERPYLRDYIKGTKACLTGPFTLASEVLLSESLSRGIELKVFNEHRAIMLDWVVDKFAEIMKSIGKAYSDMGMNIISMDDPILGLLVGRKIFFHSEEFIIKTLNKAISGIKEMSSIHVCGRISPKLRDILLQTNVNIMDHEFRTSEGNFKIFEKQHFEQSDKYLAMGTVQTNFPPKKDAKAQDYVEAINFLKQFIEKGINQFGRENLLIKPDCGFGALKNAFEDENFAYEIAIRKLNNMVLAVQDLK